MSETWYPLPTDTLLGFNLHDKKVFNGATAFKLVDTSGFPVDMLLAELDSKGFVIHWSTFIIAAKLAGWKDKTIHSKIEEALWFVYRDFIISDKLIERLNSLMKLIENFSEDKTQLLPK